MIVPHPLSLHPPHQPARPTSIQLEAQLWGMSSVRMIYVYTDISVLASWDSLDQWYFLLSIDPKVIKLKWKKNSIQVDCLFF